ncbi:hypothetical protein CLV32_4552 [Pedobacter duraquae]|uniref:Uncharacterized protein n=1 Tax=Pedobacter duraquae TaxID=425511 RepID=A0A4R6IBJ8_9SPHI|nr:hypothetical protein [Pedobacter duraquae]TDO19312.1 hypothetical protein CLV32_4552 [Pedobacter duraquae]
MATALAKPAPTAAAANTAMLVAVVGYVQLIPIRHEQEPLAVQRQQTTLDNARRQPRKEVAVNATATVLVIAGNT